MKMNKTEALKSSKKKKTSHLPKNITVSLLLKSQLKTTFGKKSNGGNKLSWIFNSNSDF